MEMLIYESRGMMRNRYRVIWGAIVVSIPLTLGLGQIGLGIGGGLVIGAFIMSWRDISYFNRPMERQNESS